jgi:hypothetical protein
MLLGFVLTAVAAPQWFVSPNGSDSNNGLSWRSSFATLQHPIDLAGANPATIHLRGTIRSSTVTNISGNAGLTIIGEDRARLTTSLLIVGWKKDRFNNLDVWSASAPAGLEPRELFTGRERKRADLTRLPKTGFLHFASVPGVQPQTPWNEGQNQAAFQAQDIPQMAHPEDAEVVVHQLWVTSRLPIAQIDPARYLFTFTKKSVFRMNDSKSDQPANYYLENVAEELRHPGEWYWDRRSAKIYYVPRAGESLNDFTAEVPTQCAVLEVQKSSDIEVRNVEFSGSEFRYPANSSGDGQAAITVPSAVEVSDCNHCAFISDSVIASATYGFEVVGASTGNHFSRCQVSDVGAGGIKIGHGTSGTVLEDCEFTHLGRVYASAVGVWIGNSGHNVVSHCRIADCGYTGISVGWTWGYGKSDAIDNLIADNDIEDLGHGELSDMGGIYTLGISPGTVLRHNKISHVRCTYYGGWGIYFDEGTSNVLAEDNLVTDCQTGNFHQHYGANNLVQNNIFAFAPTVAQVIRTRPEDHTSFTMERNVLVWDKTPLFGGNLQGAGIVFDHNLLFKLDGSPAPPPFSGAGNIVAPPSFGRDKNPTRWLTSASSKSLGILPFDTQQFGPRR